VYPLAGWRLGWHGVPLHARSSSLRPGLRLGHHQQWKLSPSAVRQCSSSLRPHTASSGEQHVVSARDLLGCSGARAKILSRLERIFQTSSLAAACTCEARRFVRKTELPCRQRGRPGTVTRVFHPSTGIGKAPNRGLASASFTGAFEPFAVFSGLNFGMAQTSPPFGPSFWTLDGCLCPESSSHRHRMVGPVMPS